MRAVWLLNFAPLGILGLSIAGIVSYRQLLRSWRWAVLGSFMVGAIATPPDTASQIVLSVPLCILYFVSVGLAFLVDKLPFNRSTRSR